MRRIIVNLNFRFRNFEIFKFLQRRLLKLKRKYVSDSKEDELRGRDRYYMELSWRNLNKLLRQVKLVRIGKWKSNPVKSRKRSLMGNFFSGIFVFLRREKLKRWLRSFRFGLCFNFWRFFGCSFCAVSSLCFALRSVGWRGLEFLRALVVLVRKKDQNFRFCADDYRCLNAVTKRDTYPLPRAYDIFDRVAGAK